MSAIIARKNIVYGQGPIACTKSISNILKPNFVCLLTNEIYKTYLKGFHSTAWVMHAPGVGLGGSVGGEGGRGGLGVNIFFSEIQQELVCELLT